MCSLCNPARQPSVGGTLVGGEVTEPHEKRNGTIQGGIKRKFRPAMWFAFLRKCRINSFRVDDQK